MKQVNYYISNEQNKKLEIVSKELDIRKSEILRRSVDDFLRKHEMKKLREAKAYAT